MREAVIVEALRTPIGRGKPVIGDLFGFHPAHLLAIAQRAVQAHRGQIVAQARADGGLRMRITLPLS